jgi:hypothetical protein
VGRAKGMAQRAKGKKVRRLEDQKVGKKDEH